MGPNIQAIPMRLGAPAVENVIKNGMSGGMPAFAGQVDATQIQQIIAYLMTLTHKDTGTVTGDAAKGKTVYDASGCAVATLFRERAAVQGRSLPRSANCAGPAT